MGFIVRKEVYASQKRIFFFNIISTWINRKNCGYTLWIYMSSSLKYKLRAVIAEEPCEQERIGTRSIEE
jgi:hypothetical protein